MTATMDTLLRNETQMRSEAGGDDLRALPSPGGQVGPPPQRGAADAASPADPLPDGYQPLALPKRGSFSELWKVADPLGRVRALKRLRPEWRSDQRAQRLLCNEVQVSQSVKSAYVIRVDHPETEMTVQTGGDSPAVETARSEDGQKRETGSFSPAARPDVDASTGGTYVLMEWVDGQTVEERLQQHGALPPAEAVWIARQAAQGLRDMACSGFIHGDVKPSNLLVDRSGHVRLIDLGFARPIKADRPCSLASEYLTGTPEYMAPEKLCGRHGGLAHAGTLAATDLYSLGVTMYRLLSGRLPFQSETAEGLMRLHRSARPPRLERHCPDIPPLLARLVERLLAKQPIRRPASAEALLKELLALELVLLPRRFCA